MNENTTESEINRLAAYIAAEFQVGMVDDDAVAPRGESACEAAVRLLKLAKSRCSFNTRSRAGELSRIVSPIEYTLALATRGGAKPPNRPRNATEERVHKAILGTLAPSTAQPPPQEITITATDNIEHDRLFDVVGASGFGFNYGNMDYRIHLPRFTRPERVTLYMSAGSPGEVAEVIYGRDEGEGIPVTYRVLGDGRMVQHADVYYVGWPPR